MREYAVKFVNHMGDTVQVMTVVAVNMNGTFEEAALQFEIDELDIAAVTFTRAPT